MSTFDESIQLIRGTRHLDPLRTEVCVKLMKEYLRREALWAGELGLSDEIPFADLSVTLSDVDYAGRHLESIKVFAHSQAEYRSCMAMLNWYGWQESVNAAPGAFGIPDPYLPLLHFFRQGGTFTREHRVFIGVNGQVTINAPAVQKGNLDTPFVTSDE